MNNMIFVSPVAPTQNDTIDFGVSTFSADTSDHTVATVTVSGSTVTATPVGVGSCLCTVTDSSSPTPQTASFTIVVQDGLYCTPNVLIFPQGGGPLPSVIMNGVSTYTVTSSNTGIATVAHTGTAITVTPVAPGSCVINVSDSAGGTAVISVTVNGPSTPVGCNIMVFDTSDNLVDVPADGFEFEVEQVVNGGASTGYIIFPRQYYDIGNIDDGYRVQIYLPDSAQPYWDGRVVKIDRLNKDTRADMRADLEGWMTALDYAIVSEILTPGVQANGVDNGQMDAGTYLTHLASTYLPSPPAQVPVTIGYVGESTIGLNLDSLQFDGEGLSSCINDVITQLFDDVNGIWEWFVVGYADKTINLVWRPEQDPNVQASASWLTLFMTDLDQYQVVTDYTRIKNMLVAYGGKDPSTGLTLWGPYTNSASIADHGLRQAKTTFSTAVSQQTLNQFATAWLAIYADPEDLGQFRLLKPTARATAGQWLQIWETPGFLREGKITRVQLRAQQGQNRIEQWVYFGTPLPSVEALSQGTDPNGSFHSARLGATAPTSSANDAILSGVTPNWTTGSTTVNYSAGVARLNGITHSIPAISVTLSPGGNSTVLMLDAYGNPEIVVEVASVAQGTNMVVLDDFCLVGGNISGWWPRGSNAHTTLDTQGNIISSAFGAQLVLQASGIGRGQGGAHGVGQPNTYAGYYKQAYASFPEIDGTQSDTLAVGDWLWQVFYAVNTGGATPVGYGPIWWDGGGGHQRYEISFNNGVGTLKRFNSSNASTTLVATFAANQSGDANLHHIIVGLQYVSSGVYRLVGLLDGTLCFDYTDTATTLTGPTVFPGFLCNADVYHRDFQFGPDPQLVSDVIGEDRNLIPDSDIKLGAHYWKASGASCALTSGIGPNGGNGIQVVGTGGASSSTDYMRSIPINVTPGAVYTLSAYVDATYVTGSTLPRIKLVNAGTTTDELAAAWYPMPAGQKGRASVSITIPGGITQIEFLFMPNGATIGSLDALICCMPKLQTGPIATGYTPNALDDASGGIVNSTMFIGCGSFLNWSNTPTWTFTASTGSPNNTMTIVVAAAMFQCQDGSTVSVAQGTFTSVYPNTYIGGGGNIAFDIAYDPLSNVYVVNGQPPGSITAYDFTGGHPSVNEQQLDCYGDQRVCITCRAILVDSGSGSGGGGTSAGNVNQCPADFQVVPTVERGLVRADELNIGDHLYGANDEPVEILGLEKRPTMLWQYSLVRGDKWGELYVVNDGHQIQMKDGVFKAVRALRTNDRVSDDVLVSSAQAYGKGDYIAITVEGHVYKLGLALCHNVNTL